MTSFCIRALAAGVLFSAGTLAALWAGDGGVRAIASDLAKAFDFGR